MWLPANRDPIFLDVAVPGEAGPWFGYPWAARR
jgi:hypothetical protein